MTIGDALAAVGMDSKSLEVAREMPEGQPYPLRIIRYRKSVHDVFKTRAGVEAAMPLSMAEGDTIVVEDFRLLDGKIKQASENLTEAVALGSVDTCTALTDLVNLRQEQAKWPEPVRDWRTGARAVAAARARALGQGGTRLPGDPTAGVAA